MRGYDLAGFGAGDDDDESPPSANLEVHGPLAPSAPSLELLACLQPGVLPPLVFPLPPTPWCPPRTVPPPT